MNPIVAWPGGKRALSKQILPLLPKHTCYCEPFGGGAAILLAKGRSPIEVYNDLNGELVNLFRVVKYHPTEFKRCIRLVLNSRQEFDDLKRQRGLTDIQRAVSWFIQNRLSFGGKGSHYGYGRKSGGAASGSRFARMRAVMELNRRLDSVNIEHLPWDTCVQRYDSEGTLFFLDPPYVEGSRGVYGPLAFAEEDHRALREMLAKVQAKWVLTYGDHPMIRDLYEGCRIVEVSRARGIGNNHRTIRRRIDELIIMPEAA